MGAAPYFQKIRLGYVLVLRDHALVSIRHHLLIFRQHFNNLLVPVQVKLFNCLGEQAEDSITCMPVFHDEDRDVGVTHGGFIKSTNAIIAVPDRRMCHHADSYDERTAQSKKLRDIQQVRQTQGPSIVAYNTRKERFNASVSEQLFYLEQHWCHLTEGHSSAKASRIYLKLHEVLEKDCIPTDATGIFCILLLIQSRRKAWKKAASISEVWFSEWIIRSPIIIINILVSISAESLRRIWGLKINASLPLSRSCY